MKDMTPKQQQSEHQPLGRKAPGILRVLPESLSLYPYGNVDANGADSSGMMRMFNGDYQAGAIPNAPLRWTCDDNNPPGMSGGFTLFFLVDSTNRQSLLALPLVSQWCRRALNRDGDMCICIPNHPTPNEIDRRNLNSDSGIHTPIDSSITPTAKQHNAHMLSNTGFYHLPFLHPKRVFLLNLLGATRVPCVIVVSNDTGRIVSRYGWEAIEREMGDELVRAKMGDGSAPCFESRVVREWRKGNSGLPFWWHLFSWLL